jgi:aryl-alcohol dehydrogenase-like predicted oxidoreductase
MQTEARRIGPFSVPPIGLGCMTLSHAYGMPPQAEQGEALLRAALDAGVQHFDTAALYGFGANEKLVGRVLKPHRDRILLASKGGMAGVQFPEGMKRVIDGRPEAILRNCDDSLARLGVDHIDLYYLHRWDKKVPIEDSVGALARLVAAGKVRAIGLSEVSATTIRRAHAVHRIAAVQNEYSLWTRNAEIGTLAACAEIGAAFVAFSPLARSFLTGKLTDVGHFEPKDIRRGMPRFQPEAYAKNLLLLDEYATIARDAGCTMGQLALAWLLARGPHVHAIPGTTNVEHLRENMGALAVQLQPETIGRLDALINQHTVTGPRYNATTQAEIDTEEF